VETIPEICLRWTGWYPGVYGWAVPTDRSWKPACPPGPGQADVLLPACQGGEFRVAVLDHADEVTITVDIIPGGEKKGIRLDLVNPRAGEISFERKKEREQEKEGYQVRERSFGSMHRIVPLPEEVTGKDATRHV
jgi:HSP20 family molecular chaperone IbpA